MILSDSIPGAALDPEEPVSWDDDSDSDAPSTPQPKVSSTIPSSATNTISSTSHSSTTTIQPQASASAGVNCEVGARQDSLKPSDAAPRRSQDQHSQTDSDASYDLVSGATSRAPGSPKEERGNESKEAKKEESDDDEPDWE